MPPSKKRQAVQWYTCKFTEDVGCGKPLKERNGKGCAECPIYQRVQPIPNCPDGRYRERGG